VFVNNKDYSVDTLLITTPRLTIRNLKESDLDDFLQYRSNPEVTRYQGFDVFTQEQALQFIKEHKDKKFSSPGEWVQYGIEVPDSRELIGDCAIHLQKDEPQIAELGITISDLHQRKGFAKEAMLGLMNYLFSDRKILRILETVDADNLPSIALLKSLSFRQEGHFIENVFFKGKWGSEFQFAMLASEWDRLQGQSGK
jgi:ribosomal-protein-alanine N-acetyltransferase